MIEPNRQGEVWVFAEQEDDHLSDVSLELCGKARELADQLKVNMGAVLAGHNVRELSYRLIALGADKVYHVSDPHLEDYRTLPYARVMCGLIAKHEPQIVLYGATAQGRDLAPRIASQMKAGLTADCTDLDIGDYVVPKTKETHKNLLLQIRPAFGGNIIATIINYDRWPQMATVREGVMRLTEGDPARPGVIIEETVEFEDFDLSVRLIERHREKRTVNLKVARTIVAGGAGVASKKDFQLIHDLAGAIGGAVGASRGAVDGGFVGKEHQVGQTGTTVRPALYIACGISGAVQHRAGMEESAKIIAINTDKDAPIFSVAHYGIVGDLRKIIPTMIKAIKERAQPPMANFFDDNEDLLFLFDHLDLRQIAQAQEEGFPGLGDVGAPGAEYAPADVDDAIDNYRRVLRITGDVAGNAIAPRSGGVDRTGHQLNEDGTVTLHPDTQANLNALAQAGLMGFTLPRRYGGLSCPTTIYTMAIEIVSRADASLMNLFGLQGIAETINAFADDDVKDEYLPRFCAGEVTGAMALTEPDAGSDLQAVALRASRDQDGDWRLTGVKRFITNGCGEVLLTLARSEPGSKDGRGLSLFLAERGPRLHMRRLEGKLGIHGSPTCELVYDDTPAKLIGERQLGLIRYVMSLMNGARLGIAGQSLGIAEASYREARRYAHTRKQFGVPIQKLPAVAEMLVDMKVAIEAARALVYETSRVCDLEHNNLRILESGELDKDQQKQRKNLGRGLKRINGMLTPMSKYYASEMCITVANDALQVLGGSGYMTDYPVERYTRNARITTIYEGTSQLQVVAAVRGVCSGTFEKMTEELGQRDYDDETLAALKARLDDGRQRVLEAITFVKEQGGDYMDLVGRKLVDAAITVIVGHLLLRQAADSERKRLVARRFIDHNLANLTRDMDLLSSGDTSPLSEFDILAGPVPSIA